MSHDERMSVTNFWRLARQREDDGHLSALRQVGEAAFLRLFHGVGPGYYQLAAFWDRSTTWHDKTHHLSEAEYQKKLLALNPPEYRKLSQNKLAEKALFRLLGIPSPEYLGHYHQATGKTADGAPLTDASSLRAFLEQRPDLEKICFKGIEGWGGNGFEPIKILRGKDEITLLRLRTSETVRIDDFCRDVLTQGIHAFGSIIEQFIQQHDVLSQINPSSINTLRIWSLQNEDYTTATILAVLRIGRSGSVVDNRSGGGMMAPIDLQTGSLLAAVDGTTRRRRFSRHPDHGAVIEDVQLPFFKEAVMLAERSVKEFPNIRFAGVDVAITADGPCIVELNVWPSRDTSAIAALPAKPLFP